MWETTVGAAIAGDDSLKAALREVKEEIGIDLSPINGKYLFRLKRQQQEIPDFVDRWMFKGDVDITNVIHQPEEVCGSKWATPDQIKSMIELGESTDTFIYLDDLIKVEDIGKVPVAFNLKGLEAL